MNGTLRLPVLPAYPSGTQEFSWHKATYGYLFQLLLAVSYRSFNYRCLQDYDAFLYCLSKKIAMRHTLFPYFKFKEVGKVNIQSLSQYIRCANSRVDFPALNTPDLTWHNLSRICQVFLRNTFAHTDSPEIFPERFDYFGVLGIIHASKIETDCMF
jgi:hypothetical protein